MSSQDAHDNRDPRLLFSGVLFVGTFVGFVACLFYAHPTIAFVVASLIFAALALVTHIYCLHHPSESLNLLVIVWLAGGINVAKAWIPGVGNSEQCLFYCFTLALLSASTLVVSFRQRKKLHEDVVTESLQATRDSVSGSASRFTLVGPACLSSGRHHVHQPTNV